MADNRHRQTPIYSSEQTRSAIEQLHAAHKEAVCGLSTIEITTEILIGGEKHAGTVAHICGLDKGHEGSCQCRGGCPYRWVKNTK